MSYSQKNLLSDEKILYCTKPHYMLFSTTCIWALLVLVITIFTYSTMIPFLLLIILINFANDLMAYYCSEYTITNKRVIMKTGFIRRQSLEIFLDRIEGVFIEQSILGRMFDFGTIVVCGIGGSKSCFPYVPKPNEFNNKIQQTQKGILT